MYKTLLITNINFKEINIINNIFNSKFNYFNIDKIIDIVDINIDIVDINVYNKIIYIYDKNIKNVNLSYLNDSIIKYEINNIINIKNIIDILNILDHNLNNYYNIYYESIVSNIYYLKNINHNEYKNQYLLNSYRIFDKNGNYINNQTCVEACENISIIPLDNTKYNKICFYINNSWAFNHHSQFIELLPTLILCKKIIYENNYNITEIDFIIYGSYKDIYEELFEIIGINNKINKIYINKIPDDINEYYFQYSIIYNFGILYNHRNKTHPLFLIFTEYLKYYFNYKNINIKYDNNGIALLRDSSNNNNTWSERCISNNNELINCLKSKNIKIINTEKMSLFDKFKELSNKKFIIIEAGASMPNLYFIEKLHNTKIILLCNENMYNFHGIYEDQLRYYFNNIDIIVCNMTNSNEEKSNSYVNRPFTVNIDNIINSIMS
jgi:hypothetical protein